MAWSAGSDVSHRTDFWAQQCLVGVRVAALCHIARVCIGAAAPRVLFLPLAGLNLPAGVAQLGFFHS